ncbi:MAG: ABC transporter permease, partial [Rariglobus sp.]
ETIGTTAVIGCITNSAREFMQTDVVVVIVLLYAFLGKGADLTVRVLEHFFLPWHHAYGRPGQAKRS